MEDDLQKKNGRRTPQKMEDDLKKQTNKKGKMKNKKMEDELKKIKNKRQPQKNLKKIKTTSKKICS